MIDPKTMINLTFTNQMQVPTKLYPTFFLYKPGGISSILETAFELLVCFFPRVGLIKIHSFLVSPPLVSLPLDVSGVNG